MSRRRSKAATLPPAALTRWPGLAEYIEGRRLRGIPAEGQWIRPRA